MRSSARQKEHRLLPRLLVLLPVMLRPPRQERVTVSLGNQCPHASPETRPERGRSHCPQFTSGTLQRHGLGHLVSKKGLSQPHRVIYDQSELGQGFPLEG